MINAPQHPDPPRWLHAWALLTVAAACVLLFLGALVTSMRAGMADQRPVVLPHQALEEFAEGTQGLGWQVEHGHRLAGWFVGVCGIVLVAGSWLGGERGVRWLATLGLVLIVCQGMLGIFRISLNAWWGDGLAWVHGSFAQVVFAVLVSVALVSSRGWRTQVAAANSKLRLWSLLCVAIVFGQLVLGGMVRHQGSLLTARLHLLGAFGVLAALLWLAKMALDEKEMFRWSPRILLALLALQILVGVEAWLGWMSRHLDPMLASRESVASLILRSAHYVLGSAVFAATVVMAWIAHRGLAFSLAPQTHPSGRLEGTA